MSTREEMHYGFGLQKKIASGKGLIPSGLHPRTNLKIARADLSGLGPTALNLSVRLAVGDKKSQCTEHRDACIEPRQEENS